MWTDILAAGISPADVSLVACPGGPITRAEILLARALGARVGWLDPKGRRRWRSTTTSRAVRRTSSSPA